MFHCITSCKMGTCLCLRMYTPIGCALSTEAQVGFRCLYHSWWHSQCFSECLVRFHKFVYHRPKITWWLPNQSLDWAYLQYGSSSIVHLFVHLCVCMCINISPYMYIVIWLCVWLQRRYVREKNTCVCISSTSQLYASNTKEWICLALASCPVTWAPTTPLLAISKPHDCVSPPRHACAGMCVCVVLHMARIPYMHGTTQTC